MGSLAELASPDVRAECVLVVPVARERAVRPRELRPAALRVGARRQRRAGVAAAVARLRSEGRPVLAWSPRWRGDAHAGRTETSLMLAIASDRVSLSRAAPGNVEALPSLLPRLRAEGVLAVSPNGVLGDPAGATADEGRALLDA